MGLVQNTALINGKRAFANSTSHAQTNSKKNCAPYSSSTSLVLHSTLSTSSQPTPPPQSQSDARSRLHLPSLFIMKASYIARHTSPELWLNNWLFCNILWGRVTSRLWLLYLLTPEFRNFFFSLFKSLSTTPLTIPLITLPTLPSTYFTHVLKFPEFVFLSIKQSI